MKSNIPQLNVFIGTFYLTCIIINLYVLKLSLHKRKIINKQNKQQQSMKNIDDADMNKLLGLSWVKKYTLIGAIIQSDRKYLLKQLLIISTYGIICLKINKITIWPISLIICLLPVIFILFEIFIDKIDTLIKQCSLDDKMKSNNQNQIRSTNLEININTMIDNQAVVGINNKINSRNNNKMIMMKDSLIISKDRSLAQMLIIVTFGFVGTILYFQTVMTLTNSISNSGQLNITSLLVILCIDQFFVRSVSGLSLFALFKILVHFQCISPESNLIVLSLCKEEIILFIKERQNTLNKRQENTSSPFKIQNQLNNKRQLRNQQIVAQINIINDICLDLFAIENQQQNIKKQEDQVKFMIQNKIKQEEDLIFLTTPQRQLFQKGQSQQTIMQERTILNDITNHLDKQNTNVQNHDKSSLISQSLTKEAITNNQQTIDNPVLRINDFSLENSIIKKRQSKRKVSKRGAKRKLIITGNSPYLQYLPNMLKNVEKYKEYSKDKDMNQPKKML